jgi:hypothetical protein
MSRTVALLLMFFALLAAGCGRSDLGEDLFDTNNPEAGVDGSKPDGGDGGKPCSTAAECDDKNACTKDSCQNGRCQNIGADDDNDTFVSSTCGGNDCNDRNAAVNPAARENCANKVDDNCDGKTDCDDPTCKDSPGCKCLAAEVCGNNIDDDCNGQSDCADRACQGKPPCNCAATETCGNNVDDDCNGRTDCDDNACANTQACRCNRPEQCGNGVDDDCDGRIDCDDPDCANTQACRCRNTQEVCTNNADDNCNLLVDCADPDCRGTAACSCNGRPPQPENCTNGIDDDCDGRRDCQDPDCFASPACRHCTQEVCNDGRDNDCDGLIDCADDACFFAPECAPTQEQCNNGIDDDHDTLIDCFDPDCKTNPKCVLEHSNCNTAMLISGSGTFTGNTTGFIGDTRGTCGGAAGEAVFYFTLNAPSRIHLDTVGSAFDTTLYLRSGSCKGGRELACDDDTGGNRNARIDIPILYPGTYFVFVDGFTVDPNRGPDEGRYVLNVQITPNPPEICDNGIDDDGDRFVDCADPACTTVGSCLNCRNGQAPTAEFGATACTDGVDNDCDGLTDCADPDCRASDYYVTECCNGQDDNGNGIIDEFACRCASNANCRGGQICYTHTTSSCAPPCNQIVGDICPFVAAGSTCSTSTRECEFPP